MYHKSRQFRQHQRERAIVRKKEIAKAIYGTDAYEVDGQYSKGKVHCSCPLCAYHRESDERIREQAREVEREIRAMR